MIRKSTKLQMPGISLLLLLVLTMLFYSCSTKPEEISLSGTVVLENDTGNQANDPPDHSGITIALYNTVALDTAIVRSNIEYPEIGVIISQETEFDHRRQNPVFSGSTGADGKFKLNGIAKGRYNIMYGKTGWGWRYIYNCEIGNGSNNLASFLVSGEAKLFPEYQISNFDSLDLLKEDHTYIVPTSATITHGLQIESGANLLLGLGVDLTITGDLSTRETGSGRYSLISVAGDVVDYGHCFGRILVQGDVILTRVRYSNTMNGLQFRYGDVALSHIRGQIGPTSLILRENSSVHASKLTISDIGILDTTEGYLGITTTTEGGIDLTSCQNTLIEKSVFIRCLSGVRVREYCEAEVANCYLVNNSIGLEVANNNSLIQNNHFAGNYCLDTRLYGTCSPTVTKNCFYSKRGANVGYNVIQTFINCTPVITFNNFSCQTMAIRIIGYNNYDVTANYNYYNTNDPEKIEQLIIDQNDYNPSDISNMVHVGTGYILYLPYRTSRVPDAGIRGGS